MKTLQVHTHVLLCFLTLALFKTSNADSQCHYFYDIIPPQTIDCDPSGQAVKLSCFVRVSRDHPTSVKWFWNQAGPAACPGINEALNSRGNYLLESTDPAPNSDGLFQYVHILTIINFTLPADSGYYWCQIVVNDTALLQPPPPLYISSSLAGTEKCAATTFSNDSEPDLCATNGVEEICSAHVRPVNTHTCTSIESAPSSVIDSSFHSSQLQLSTKLTTMTPSSIIAPSKVSSMVAQGTPFVTDPGVTDPGVTDPGVTDPGVTDPDVTDRDDMKSLIIAVVVSAFIAVVFSIITCTLCLYIYYSKKKKKLPTAATHANGLTDSDTFHNAVSTQLELQDHLTTCPAYGIENVKVANNLTDQDGLHSAVYMQVELQDYTTSRSPDNIEAEYDPQSVPDYVDEILSTDDDQENSTERQTHNCSEVGPSARHTPADPTGVKTTVDGKAGVDMNLCSYNNQIKEHSITVKEKDTQGNQQHKLKRMTAESTTHTANDTEGEYALPFAKSSDAHIYDDIKGEEEMKPGLTEPEPHYYSVIPNRPSEILPSSSQSVPPPLNTGPAGSINTPIVPSSHTHSQTNAKTHLVSSSDTRVYSEPWESIRPVDGERTNEGNSGHHMLEERSGHSSSTGKEQAPVTKELVPPSKKTSASTRLYDNMNWSHHSPIPAVARAHPPDDASPSGAQYAEPWSTHSVKQDNVKKPAPFYHTLERSTKQSEDTATADPKPVTPSGALIPPSTGTPPTSSSLSDYNDWSHHSPAAMEHPPDDASSSSTQYAEPWNVKQGSAKKPAPFYHTLERSTKQSETATADPKPVTPSGALIPPSTRTPPTSSSLNDHNDWSHHSPDPTVAKAHSSDCVSSISIQYAEPHVKTMQDSVKKPAPFYHTLESSTKQTTTADPKLVTSPGEADSAEIQAHSLGMSDVIFDDPAYLPPSSTFTTSTSQQ